MTHLEPEDILRRALHAAAESVEPATEGLTQIRARLSTPHPLAVAWLLGAWEAVSQFVMLRLEEALDWLANSLHTALRTADGLLYPAAERLRPLTERLQPVTDRLRPALAWLAAAVAWVRRVIQPTQAGSEERRSRYAWVRPAVAMAVVVLVAVVGGIALSGRLNQISQAASSVFSSSSTHGSGGGTHHSGVSGSGGTHPQPASGPSGKNGTTPSPSPSCRPRAKAKPHPTATPKPTQTPTQSVSSSPPASTPPPTTPPPTTPPPSSPPPTSGPAQGTSSASATQVAHDTAVVIIGARSGSAATANPTPSPCSSGGS